MDNNILTWELKKIYNVIHAVGSVLSTRDEVKPTLYYYVIIILQIIQLYLYANNEWTYYWNMKYEYINLYIIRHRRNIVEGAIEEGA
jgi:hypothetical protein